MNTVLEQGRSAQLRCHYFEAGLCRSCTLIETPYETQLLEKDRRCRELLPQVAADAWLTPVASVDRGFRNKVKLAVGGSAGAVTLGILDAEGQGVDLRECAIQSPDIAAVIPLLASLLDETGLAPYDVPNRQGELKFVHVTVSPDKQLMLRFVVRSEYALHVLRGRLGELQRSLPQASVISVNLLPEHKAVLEGEREVLLHGSSLAMRLASDVREITLHLQPRSFFQTNTEVAVELYRQVVAWLSAAKPASLWDLYCGVGGFALYCAASLGGDVEVLGVEVSDAAVQAAKRSSLEAGLDAQFIAADATRFALDAAPESRPEALIVNPPRRGIGAELATWIEHSGVQHVVYSSCNPESLARDLALMPSYEVREARVFDMFANTAHLEVAVLLECVS